MISMKIIGYFSEDIIGLLKLDIMTGTPIYLGESNVNHMKERHPAEFDMYFNQIDDIISSPDYVGTNPKNNSVDFVKVFRVGTEYIQVSVRVSSSGKYFARTLFLLASFKAERYIEQGSLIPVKQS